MLDYTKELTLHIQGLGMNFHQAFQEIDKTTQVEIPPDVDIHSISIRKIGGYKPQLVRIMYLDSNEQEQQQAYMAKYVEGNLVCIPIEEESINHPFLLEMTLPGSPFGLILHIDMKYINQERNLHPKDFSKWVAIYQDAQVWIINPYVLDSHSNLTYLHT